MLRVIDVECSDMEGEIIEIGHTDVENINGVWTVGRTRSWLCDPGCLIEFGAMGVHHITDEMVKGRPLLSDIIKTFGLYVPDRDDDPIEAFVAHNAKYERDRLATLAPNKASWICTWKVAHALAPKLKSHSNQAMRYALRLDVDEARASPPHRAGPDTYVTAHLLVRALAKLSVLQMVAISARPILLQYCPIGEHRGKPFEEIDSGLLRWFIDKIKDNEDLVFTAKHHLRERNERTIND